MRVAALAGPARRSLTSSNRQLHRFYGLFLTPVLNRESEEMIHDEGLLARFLGAWFDSCMAGWEKMASDAVHENLIFELMDNMSGMSGNMLMSMGWPMMRK